MPIDNSRDKDDIMKMMQGFPPAANHQALLANWREPDIARWSFNHLRQLLPTAPMHPASPPTALATARQDLDDLSFLDARGDRQKLGAFLAASQSDCFAVMKDGKLVYDWFGGFGAPDRQHIVFSITKSMASLLAGVLVGAGVINVQRQITDYLPELGHSAYAGATMRHLLDMQIASGFREDYLDTDGVFMAYRRASAWNPIEEGDRNDGLRDFLTKMPVSDAAHGTRHHYCSPHSDVLGWVIERSGGASFAELFSHNILAHCGAQHEAYISLDTFGAPRVSGGLCITIHDLLRIGQMMCDGGWFAGQQIVPQSWIDDIYHQHDNHIWLQQEDNQGPRLFVNGNYRSQWYRPDQNRQIACAIGIHGQWLWIDRAARLVIVKMASNGTVVDTDTDRTLLAAFDTIEAALD
ncbi:beta-lactamase family protein [Alphaproteobacteria bacterium]|nr:beta-lactamase family protein [Alphaproteobacteria bacterium]